MWTIIYFVVFALQVKIIYFVVFSLQVSIKLKSLETKIMKVDKLI
jgi:cell division protein FtsL